MLESLVSILSLATMALAAYGVGRPVVRALRVAEEDGLTAAVWSLAAGAIAVGLGLAVLGVAGVLSPSLVGVTSVAAAFWGAGEVLRERLRQERGRGAAGEVEFASEETDVGSVLPPPRWLLGLVGALAAAACVGSLVGALAPPSAGDALCYHLDLPKRFLAAGGLIDLPYNDNATFPLLTEMWYLWGLALDGPVAAQLVHWAMGLLLAGAGVVLARPILGVGWAWLVGAVVLLTPGVNNQMTAPLNDLSLAAMGTLVVAAWWRGVVAQEDRRWFVLAGLAAGGALGTKYVALVLLAAIGAGWLWALLGQRDRRRRLLEAAAIATVVAASTGGLWYVRAAYYRGNPVYPFFGELAAAADSPTGGFETLPARKAPLGRGPLALAAAPWQVTMHPERFGGRGHQLGVLYLAMLPGLLFARRLRGLGTLLGAAAVYGVLWFLLRQNVRFLFPVIPLLAVAVVWVAMETRRFGAGPRLAAAAVPLVILSVFAAVALSRSGDCLGVALGLESRDDYLARREPTYPIASVANLLAKPGHHLLSQDCRMFYFDGPVTRESVFRRTDGYDRLIREPSDFSRVLRRAGFTHVLLVERPAEDAAAADPTLGRLADADPTVVHVTQTRATDPDGRPVRYRLLSLGTAEVASLWCGRPGEDKGTGPIVGRTGDSVRPSLAPRE